METHRVIEIEDSGYVWAVPLAIVAADRAAYYAKRDPDTTYENEFEYVMEDDYEGLDWFLNNMDWKDVAANAVLVCQPSPLKEPRPAHWEVELKERPTPETPPGP